MLEHIWLHGFHTTEEDIWTKPPLPACYHRTRLQIANEIHSYSLSSFRLCNQKPKKKPVKEIDVTGDDDSLEEEGEEGIDNGSETDEDEEESGLSTDTDDD